MQATKIGSLVLFCVILSQFRIDLSTININLSGHFIPAILDKSLSAYDVPEDSLESCALSIQSYLLENELEEGDYATIQAFSNEILSKILVNKLIQNDFEEFFSQKGPGIGGYISAAHRAVEFSEKFSGLLSEQIKTTLIQYINKLSVYFFEEKGLEKPGKGFDTMKKYKEEILKLHDHLGEVKGLSVKSGLVDCLVSYCEPYAIQIIELGVLEVYHNELLYIGLQLNGFSFNKPDYTFGAILRKNLPLIIALHDNGSPAVKKAYYNMIKSYFTISRHDHMDFWGEWIDHYGTQRLRKNDFRRYFSDYFTSVEAFILHNGYEQWWTTHSLIDSFMDLADKTVQRLKLANGEEEAQRIEQGELSDTEKGDPDAWLDDFVRDSW